MAPLTRFAVCLAALTSAAQAISPPTYAAYGWHLFWYDYFGGSSGSPPNPWVWNLITGNLGFNDELETYTSSSSNIQLTGDEYLQIIPRRDSSQLHGWSSGRIESIATVTPYANALTMIEAPIRFGTNPNQQGIWPAFWLSAQSLRAGQTQWPASGELDIMEAINGVLKGFGTAHCGTYPGGPCNEPVGLSEGINIPNDGNFHTWRILIDRTPSNWQDESITWYMDGATFNTITGATVGDPNVWATLAHDPLFIVFNVAVGGDWAGAPNAQTQDGPGSMMEVQYVAMYHS